jgi:hypothetical protein
MAKDKKNATQLQLWFEDAWEGWIRPLGLILLLAIGYLLYKFDIVGERTTGITAVLAIVVGAIVVGALPALPLATKPWQRALLATMVAAALAGMVYPSVRAAVPGRQYVEATLTNDKPTATMTTGAAGPYELLVSGHFKDAGRQDAEATYNLKVTDNGGGSEEVNGEIARKLVTIHSRKGGSSSSVQEQNEEKHRLGKILGPQVTVTADGVDEQLENGLTVALRAGGLDPVVFIVLGALAILIALVLDTRLVDVKGKQKAYLTAAMAIAFSFSMYYWRDATPSRLVKTAVSALFFALIVGGIGGWAAGGIARALFGPKIPKKKSGASSR